MNNKPDMDKTIADFYIKFFQIRKGMTIAQVTELLTDTHMKNCSYLNEPGGQISWTFYKRGWHTGYVIIFEDKKVVRTYDNKNLKPPPTTY
ncbi:MAG: hypothetical protein Q8O30_13630 [Candidatus Omnitrophota bacterium]|nr:hypothetical protein [Candidatus Omnitrophota bacterium]